MELPGPPTATVANDRSSILDDRSCHAKLDGLFRAMLQGDDRAFAELFAAFDAKLRRYLVRQIGVARSEPTVEDVLQEVWVRFIQLRRDPPRFANDRSSDERSSSGPFLVQAFLFRIARNLVIDRRRTEKEHLPIDTLDERFHPMTAPRDGSDPEEIMRRAFAELPDDFREVLVLNLELGFRFDEIAVMLGKTPEAIWQRASRARAKLRRLVMNIAQAEGVSLRGYTDEEPTQASRGV